MNGVCFIFDGLDEYSQKYTADGCSWFEQLLRGHIFPSSKIIIAYLFSQISPTFTFKNVIRALRPLIQWKSLGVE